MAAPAKTCFVISPIGPGVSPTRTRSDQVFEFLISPVVKPRGYTPTRSDKLASPGLITTQIVRQVEDAELVVADLTDSNPNVFYELAVRHVTKRPLIQLMQSDQDIPFDVAGMRTIKYDMTDPFKIEEAKAELTAALDAIEDSSYVMETPISAAVNLRALRESDDLVARTLADMQEQMSQLSSEIRLLRPRPMVLPTGGIFQGDLNQLPPYTFNQPGSIPSHTPDSLARALSENQSLRDAQRTGDALRELLKGKAEAAERARAEAEAEDSRDVSPGSDESTDETS